jgi:hypothetical protein
VSNTKHKNVLTAESHQQKKEKAVGCMRPEIVVVQFLARLRIGSLLLLKSSRPVTAPHLYIPAEVTVLILVFRGTQHDALAVKSKLEA